MKPILTALPDPEPRGGPGGTAPPSSGPIQLLQPQSWSNQCLGPVDGGFCMMTHRDPPPRNLVPGMPTVPLRPCTTALSSPFLLSASLTQTVTFWHSETKSGAEAGADREAAGGVAAHGPRLVHGRHPQCRPGDGEPQPGLLAARVQVHDGSPTPRGAHPTIGARVGGMARFQDLPALK